MSKASRSKGDARNVAAGPRCEYLALLLAGPSKIARLLPTVDACNLLKGPAAECERQGGHESELFRDGRDHRADHGGRAREDHPVRDNSSCRALMRSQVSSLPMTEGVHGPEWLHAYTLIDFSASSGGSAVVNVVQR